MEEKQKFQSEGKLFALKVHAAWEKFENVVLFPFRWISNRIGATDTFVAAGESIDRNRLKVVK